MDSLDYHALLQTFYNDWKKGAEEIKKITSQQQDKIGYDATEIDDPLAKRLLGILTLVRDGDDVTLKRWAKMYGNDYDLTVEHFDGEDEVGYKNFLSYMEYLSNVSVENLSVDETEDEENKSDEEEGEETFDEEEYAVSIIRHINNDNANFIAEKLILMFEEFGWLLNYANYRIAEWLIYQNKSEYEYYETCIDRELAAKIIHILNNEENPLWVESDEHACHLMSLACYFGVDQYDTIDSFLSWGYLGLDHTNAEDCLISSECMYREACRYAEKGAINTALEYLNTTDVDSWCHPGVTDIARNLLSSYNHKAPKIAERNIQNCYLARYYCYTLQNDKKNAAKMLKLLKKHKDLAGEIPDTPKITVFRSDETLGIEIDNPFFNPTNKRTGGKGRGGRKKKTFFQKAMITLKKMF